jgi:hypothetical protein
MLYFSLGFSAVLTAIALAAVYGSNDPQRIYLKVWFGLLFGIIPGACILSGYLTHAFVFGAVATICWLTGAGRRWFVYGSAAAFLGTYVAIGVPRAFELWQLAKEYPLESLKDRLAYEPRRAGPITSVTDNSVPDEAPEFGSVWMSNRGASAFRADTLQDLHTGCVHMFVSAPGFGIARMIHYLPSNIRRADPLREAAPLAVPEAPQSGGSPTVSTGDLILGSPTESNRPASGIDTDMLQSVHRQSAGEFLNPLGFGYVRDRDHVAGFIPHRFTQYPFKPTKPEGDGQWRFEALDLVSLLKHPEPVAYVSKHLPRMDELRDAPTRPLDEFEAEHLPKLRAGEELSSAQGPRRVRMMGAIRARAECLKCHSVEPNELLGAFSYDLRRDR